MSALGSQWHTECFCCKVSVAVTTVAVVTVVHGNTRCAVPRSRGVIIMILRESRTVRYITTHKGELCVHSVRSLLLVSVRSYSEFVEGVVPLWICMF